jgi:lipoprotein-anchoring transpeptidase ErfK/SrfK
MKSRFLAIAGAMSLALSLPAMPAFAADRSAEAVETAASAIDSAEQDMLETFGKRSLPAGQFVWRGGGQVDRLVIDLSRQMAYAYSGEDLIAVSTISSGDKNHLSPIGIFPILEKQTMHRSKKYDDAPMPFMQRITDTGVALHAGHLPGYPASHGCLRLPAQFATKLFGATRVGTEVLIAEPDGPPGMKRQSTTLAYKD